MSITPGNFGGNVRIEPALVTVPATRNDVLALFEQHRGRRLRAIGSLHSWSEAARPDDIAVDLRHFDQVTLITDAPDGQLYVEAGAGCPVDRVLDYLQQRGRYTLPVCGIVGKQTIAGAISTATHGSGRASMSHYVAAVTAAIYDAATGAAQIREWRDGDALRAARCGLGCTGVLLSVRMRVDVDHDIEEVGQWFDDLDRLLAAAREYPRHQFYLMPWSWKWYAQLRREVPGHTARVTERLVARALRIFRLLMIDVGINGAIRALAATPRGRRLIPWVFRRVMPILAPSGVRVVDRSRHLLMMRHDMFRHVECELFVPAPHMAHAAALVEWVLRWCGGDEPRLPDALAGDDVGLRVEDDIEPLRGRYLHHYPITCRRVLADDTMISMSSGDAGVEWYAISLITYERDLGPFLRTMRWLASTMARAYGARPHWGKVCPLSTEELAALYPELPRFRAHCASLDPSHRFVNEFARMALGLGRQVGR